MSNSQRTSARIQTEHHKKLLRNFVAKKTRTNKNLLFSQNRSLKHGVCNKPLTGFVFRSKTCTSKPNAYNLKSPSEYPLPTHDYKLHNICYSSESPSTSKKSMSQRADVSNHHLMKGSRVLLINKDGQVRDLACKSNRWKQPPQLQQQRAFYPTSQYRKAVHFLQCDSDLNNFSEDKRREANVKLCGKPAYLKNICKFRSNVTPLHLKEDNNHTSVSSSQGQLPAKLRFATSNRVRRNTSSARQKERDYRLQSWLDVPDELNNKYKNVESSRSDSTIHQHNIQSFVAIKPVLKLCESTRTIAKERAISNMAKVLAAVPILNNKDSASECLSNKKAYKQLDSGIWCEGVTENEAKSYTTKTKIKPSNGASWNTKRSNKSHVTSVSIMSSDCRESSREENTLSSRVADSIQSSGAFMTDSNCIQNSGKKRTSSCTWRQNFTDIGEYSGSGTPATANKYVEATDTENDLPSNPQNYKYDPSESMSSTNPSSNDVQTKERFREDIRKIHSTHINSPSKSVEKKKSSVVQTINHEGNIFQNIVATETRQSNSTSQCQSLCWHDSDSISANEIRDHPKNTCKFSCVRHSRSSPSTKKKTRRNSDEYINMRKDKIANFKHFSSSGLAKNTAANNFQKSYPPSIYSDELDDEYYIMCTSQKSADSKTWPCSCKDCVNSDQKHNVRFVLENATEKNRESLNSLLRIGPGYRIIGHTENHQIIYECTCQECQACYKQSSRYQQLLNNKMVSPKKSVVNAQPLTNTNGKNHLKVTSRDYKSNNTRTLSGYSSMGRRLALLSLCYRCIDDSSDSLSSGGSDTANDDDEGGGGDEGGYLEHGEEVSGDEDSGGGDSGSDSGGDMSMNSAELFDDQNNMFDVKTAMGEGDDSDGGPGSAGSDCSDSLTELRSRSKKGSGSSDEGEDDDEDVSLDDDDFMDSWDSFAMYDQE